jgi:hypothetical protein
MLSNQGRNARDGVVEFFRFTTVMTSEDHEDNGVVLDEQDAGVICEEWLAITSFVSNEDIAKIFREAIVDLLFF